MVKLEARKEGGNIIIAEDSFEHLLTCLDVQKFINERNADSTTCDANAVQQEHQDAIDDFNRQCRDLWMS